MSDASHFFSEGLSAHRQGQLAVAAHCYEQALALDPKHAEALHLLGVIEAQNGNPASAVDRIQASLVVAPENPTALYNLGNAFLAMGHAEEALAHYDAALELKPQYPQALLAQGKALVQSKRHYAALQSFQSVLQQQPDSSEARMQLALTLGLLRRYGAALSILAQWARNGTLPPSALTLQASLHRSQQMHEECLNRQVGAAHRRNPAILYAQALQVHRQGDFDVAIELLDAAIDLAPRTADFYFYKGHCYVNRRELQAAIECCDIAVALNPGHSSAYLNGGSALVELRQYSQAIDQFNHSIEADPSNSSAWFMKLYTQMNLCDWSSRQELLEKVVKQIRGGECPMQPLPILALTTDIDIQRLAGQHHVKEVYGDIRPSLTRKPYTSGDKIRVGYFSPDFRKHALSFLTAELYELHDRSQFEIHAFYYGTPCDDAMHLRLRKAFDHFHDVRELSDLALAQLARRLGIDIAVDLAGHTLDCRMGVFAHRAAPVQVNYLGYPGTSGHPQMDYILGDPVLTPPHLALKYSEKVAYLSFFQVNDRKRVISDRQFTRTELCLPESGVVYCCFNATYKISPESFAAWMRILQQVPRSVLLLLQGHALVAKNLRATAQAQGIDPARLVFAPPVSPEDNLARYKVADLFLDTWPFNAGTSASDALWSGLPVLTCMGEAYASRMAASLLHRAGLPELVTDETTQYVEQAVKLGNSPALLAELRSRVNSPAVRDRLFNTPQWVQDMEQIYRQMHERALAGLPPETLGASQPSP